MNRHRPRLGQRKAALHGRGESQQPSNADPTPERHPAAIALRREPVLASLRFRRSMAHRRTAVQRVRVAAAMISSAWVQQ